MADHDVENCRAEGEVSQEVNGAVAGEVWTGRTERSERGPDGPSRPAEGVAPNLSNTGALNRQFPTHGTQHTENNNNNNNNNNTPTAGGLDWLEVSAYGYWPPALWPELTEKLEEAKKKAEAGLLDAAYIVTSDGDRLFVAASGAKKGNQYCRFRLEGEGTTFAIVNRAAPHDTMPSVFISIPSLTLMRRGTREAWESACAVLASLGFVMSHHVVSRCDPCTDFAGVEVNEFTSAFMGQRYIARAKKWSLHGEGLSHTGFTLGSGMHMRVYDKLTECLHDQAKLAVMIDQRWGGQLPQAATRVEFQLRRKDLRERWNVKTVDDLVAKLPHIVEWLTHEWFRLTETEFDRENRNHSRSVISKLWQWVQRAFEAWTGEAQGPRPQPRPQRPPNDKQLKLQAVGCIAKVIATVEAGAIDSKEFLKRWYAMGVEHVKDGVQACLSKRLHLAAAGRAFSIDDDDIPF